MPKGTCALDGCDKPRKYRLYCSMHQRRYRKTGDPGPADAVRMSTAGSCSVDDCGQGVRSRGLCGRHYSMQITRGTTEAYVHAVKPCLADGCDRDAWNRGMCTKHHSRWMKYGTTELPVRILNRDTPCSVPECTRNRRIGLYCESHGRRHRKYGDPLASAPRKPATDPVDLFWSKVTPGEPDECWPWGGTISSQGYGVYTIRGVQYKAHRLACSIGMGRDIDPGKMACHRCSNPPCCNPAHVYEGDGDTNAADMVAAGRSLKGRRNNKNRLTVQQVQEVRQARGRQIGREVAARYGVSVSTIQSIWHNRNWKWLPWPDVDHDTR